MRKTGFWIALALLGIGCTPDQTGGPPGASVRLETVEDAPVEDASLFVATIRSRQSVDIRPQVSGLITEIFVSAGDDVEAGDPILQIDPARQQAIVEALAEVGLPDLAERDPATLSGGQKARVALMRVLISAPRALLLDEPFSKLDTALRDQIRALVFEKAHARGLPVLLVTHDQADADAAGGRVIRL